MEKQTLNIRYHNPNTDAETVEFIAKIFIETSKTKFEKVLQKVSRGDSGYKEESSEPQ